MKKRRNICNVQVKTAVDSTPVQILPPSGRQNDKIGVQWKHRSVFQSENKDALHNFNKFGSLCFFSLIGHRENSYSGLKQILFNMTRLHFPLLLLLPVAAILFLSSKSTNSKDFTSDTQYEKLTFENSTPSSEYGWTPITIYRYVDADGVVHEYHVVSEADYKLYATSLDRIRITKNIPCSNHEGDCTLSGEKFISLIRG